MKFNSKARAVFLFCFFAVASFASDNPFLDALHSIRVDTVAGATDLGVILMIAGGATVAFSGGRALTSAGLGGFMMGAFIAVCADPIVTLLKHLGGVQ